MISDIIGELKGILSIMPLDFNPSWKKIGMIIIILSYMLSFGFIMINHDHQVSIAGPTTGMVTSDYQWETPYASPIVTYIEDPRGDYVGWKGYPREMFV